MEETKYFEGELQTLTNIIKTISEQRLKQKDTIKRKFWMNDSILELIEERRRNERLKM